VIFKILAVLIVPQHPQNFLFYYGSIHAVKITIKDCQRRDHLLFDARSARF